MNLIAGQLADGVFEAPGMRVTGLGGIASGQVTLGFRAEDAEVALGGAGEIAAPIYSIELLGDATMVTVRVGEALVAAKAAKTLRAVIGQPVAFRIAADRCHLFDAHSGRRIAA
jgi:multiple sugar transport system ATP-binding protein